MIYRKFKPYMCMLRGCTADKKQCNCVRICFKLRFKFYCTCYSSVLVRHCCHVLTVWQVQFSANFSLLLGPLIMLSITKLCCSDCQIGLVWLIAWPPPSWRPLSLHAMSTGSAPPPPIGSSNLNPSDLISILLATNAVTLVYFVFSISVIG